MADVPKFDDIPSFDDLPDAPQGATQGQQSAVPAFDSIPAFDDIPNGPTAQSDQGTDRPAGARDQRPAPEGPFASGVREFAHSVIPGLAGAAVAPVGAAAGSVIPGPGTLIGGAAGFIGGSMAAEYAQDKALNAIGFDDSQQRAANREANPKSAFAGDLAGGMATMSPVGVGESIGKQALQRGAGAITMGGFEAGGEALQGEDFDPTRIAMAAAAGAVFPGVNKLGERVQAPAEKFLAGRPGRTANPAADQAHADVGDQSVETAVGDSALAESPPAPTGVTVGTPVENKPTNSQGEVATGRADPSYAKKATPADDSQVTTGDMDPATQAALAAANPDAPIPGFDDHPSGVGQPPRTSPPVSSPEGLAQVSQIQREAEANARQKASSQQLDQEPPAPSLDVNRQAMPAPSVEAGFPQPGEPVAAGENDATPMPKIKGTAAEPTEGQKEAGNYLKARTHDFGKPVAIETHAGQTRKGTGPEGPWENVSPYEYGYFNKTKGPDGDHIDFMRPKEGSPELGDKHFIVDQKDATTGKYDEPKVMTYYADKDMALDAFHRGFSDGKGPDRLHDITEVSRPDLVKYLAKHTSNPPKGPYGAPMPKAAKPVAERAVVKDLIDKGKTTPEAIAALPPEQVEAAIAGKRTRKYGVETGASAGYPVEGIVNSEGKPVTANTKLKAQERGAKHKEVTNWFEESAPKKDNETNGELLDRIKPKPGRGDLAGWAPSFKPKEWMWAREANSLLKKPTPANISKFRDAERLLRGGDDAVENYRGGNRVEADIAKSSRSGDDAVANAEAKNVDLGRNTEEDKLIEAIDAKRGGKFDVPHEEAESMVTKMPVKGKADIKALPRKTIDVKDSDLGKVDLKKVDESAAAKRKAEAAELAGRKSVKSKAESEGAASAGKTIAVKDFKPEDMARLVEMSNKAVKKAGLSDEEIAQRDLTKQAPVKPNDTPSYKRLLEQFANDEKGSLNLNQIKQDWQRLRATTPAKSYIARTPNAAREPHADYTRGVSDELHIINQKDKLDRQNLLEQMRDLPAGADRDALERIYKAREADSAVLPNRANPGQSHLDSLSAADRKIYDDHLAPIFKENDQLFDAISAVDPDRLGPKVDSHISRITKGDTSEYNMLKDRDDPTGPQVNGLSVNATMAHERPFVALERASDGKRFVIQNRPEGGFTLWDKYKAQRIKDPAYSFEANQPYTVKGANGNVDYTMRHATADEIEANARGRDGKGKPMKYYKNAALSAMMTNAQMGSMARHLVELARISSTPEFEALTTRSGKTASEKGYIETILPNFKGTYMDPQLAHVFDDYAKPGFNGPNWLRNLNQQVTKLLFWMPTAHIANVGTHWFVGRGFDNLNIKRGYETGMAAIKSVYNQDAYQKRLLEAGAGTIYPSVQTRGFIEQIAKGVGEEFVRDPGKWGPIADKLGVPLKKMSDAIYNTSSKVMWAANDVFLTQRVMELEKKGMSLKEAINTAERDIPNYRVPTTIGGSGAMARTLSQIVQDPTVLAFGRYHYGMWNSYANIAKDAFGSKASVGDRLDAVGKMGAMAVLAFAVYPILDKLAQAITGNENASQQRRGPLAIPSHLSQAAEGKEDIMAGARSTFTLQPLVSTVLETLANKDFRGKNIVEPGDVRAAAHGDVKSAGRVAIQEGEHAARGLISPLSTFSNANAKFKDDNAGVAAAKAVRDQAADVKNPSEAATKWERKVPINSWRDANTRFKKGGSGPIEGVYDKVFGK